KLPPCIKGILAEVQAGENVPHMGRFALVSFLNALKLTTQDIIDLFNTAPDFDEEKSRYQIDHITGEGSSTSYKPPGCDKLKTYGLCPSEEIDEICKKTIHPLSYYSYRWKLSKKKRKKSKKEKAEV
ncbi:MAG: DNA primase regulatory subunit PriL, partial [Candidatus Thermoplasmatota archaeon]|nr:DNA primase regulatory subunit PriL [Candidatus Thermoplasmatota archaeon]